MRVIVIGAGITGLITAIHLRKLGYDVLVLEKENETDGLMRTLKRNGHRFDTGTFVLQGCYDDIVGEDIPLIEIKKLTGQIFWNGKYLPFPPTFRNIIEDSTFLELSRILWDVGIREIFPNTKKKQ